MFCLEANVDQHLENVMALIYDQESADIGKGDPSMANALLAQVKLSIAVYLRNFMRSVIARFSGDELTAGSIQGYIQLFYNALISPLISQPLKKHFILIFESVVQVFLSYEQNVENVKSFYNQLFTQVQSVTSASGISNVTVTKGALYVCQVAL